MDISRWGVKSGTRAFFDVSLIPICRAAGQSLALAFYHNLADFIPSNLLKLFTACECSMLYCSSDGKT
jgi:hypothetical protein